MTALREVLELLLDRRNLSEAQAADLLVALTDPTLSPALGGALLAGLRAKGVTADEVRGFAKTMRKLARRPILPGPTLDANPVLWREWHRKRPSRWSRGVWITYFGLVSLFGIIISCLTCGRGGGRKTRTTHTSRV